MTKLEQLKKEIQRLRPEIMELKFGCEVIFNGEKSVVISFNGITEKLKLKENNSEIVLWVSAREFGSIYKILGRPITLEDVLAVCDGKIKDLENTGGYLQTWRLKNGNHNLFNFWLLGKPLDDQSEETINFLHSLIVK